MSRGIRVVLTSAPDRAAADALAEAVVRERLAACASVVPGVASVFWWDGRVQRAEEVLVLMKTAAERVDALLARAAELHPYEVPELLALPVQEAAPAYAAWVEREVRPEESA